VDDGLAADHQAEGHIFAQHVLKRCRSEGRHLYQNDDYGKDYSRVSRTRSGCRQEDHRDEQTYDGDRSHGRFADRQPQEQRPTFSTNVTIEFAVQAIKKTTTLGGSRATAQQRLQLVGVVLSRRAGRIERHVTAALSEGRDRSAVEERPGLQGVAGVHAEVLPGRQHGRRLHVYGTRWRRMVQVLSSGSDLRVPTS